MTRTVLTAAAVILSFLVVAPPGWAAWTWPLRGDVITPYHNGDDPYAGGQHRGIDIGGDVGSAVVAATPGEVRFAGTAGVSGLTVSLRTADGRYDTSYLHLSAVSVRKGDTVTAGDRLGAVGTTGSRSAVAPHLHFGVRDAGSAQAYHDPLGFLPPLATTGQPEPGAPVPSPEPVPSAPAPQPAPQPVATGRPAPIPSRARGGATPGRARGGVPARDRVGGRVTAPAHGRAGPQALHAPARGPVGRVAPGGAGATARSHASQLRSSPPRPTAAGSARRGDARGHPSSPPGSRHATQDRRARTQTVRARRADAAVRVDPTGSSGQARASEPGSSAGAGGPDMGWALACLGLLLAATLVGSSGGGQAFVKRRGAAVGRALRPLLGRG